MGLISFDQKGLGMITKDQIEKIMLEVGMAVELETPLPGDQKFEDLGLDSLDVFNMFVELETLTGFQVPDEEVEQLNTIDNVLAYFAEKGL